MKTLTVRDATIDDLPQLEMLKPAPTIHRDRLRDASQGLLRYLVLEHESEVIGFCQLVFKRPPYWSDGSDTTHLPQIVDLQIGSDGRGIGNGTLFLQHIAQIVRDGGGSELFTAVDPIDNPRAHAFYRRLGYQDLESEPHRLHWHFTDSQGEYHQGEAWNLHLRLSLNTG